MSLDITLKRSIPVRYDVDVLVVGGGPAGSAAAVAAARQGRSVYLAEGHTCLGGMGTAAMVPLFMMFSDGVNFLADGIGREILDKLRAAGGTVPREGHGIRAEILKRVYDDLLRDAGVNFTFQTNLIDVQRDGDRVTHAVFAAKSGLFAVRAKFFIDGTGDGDLCAWAGAPFEKGDAEGNLMPGTLCSIWANVDWDAFRQSKTNVHERLLDAFRDGVFSVQDRHLPGMWPVGPNLAGGNIGHTFGVDGTDERSVSKALVDGRRMLLEYERFYKQYIPGYANMDLVATGSLLGLRETRRITGDYELNLADFKARAAFPDEIGRYCYPVDIHASKPDPVAYAKFEQEFLRDYRYGKGESYGIPYRTLTPKGLANVLVTGRCISCDRYIQGSVRVMPGCYITGQAAGVAAALALERGADTRGVAIPELQARLKKLGAFLPNA
ncbi:MAG: hypothetical protein A3K19_10690 [Lentisphaerae bacterium RIFOXYB12_FULL_65_16]|nr:MAG: hypothetical protein A3K18_29840 [Lentisphaerae bacterium RIFOXYA12_64_32]OGV87918.1 MAG: hypothetical protein A3K19_10690 [Lentisphaerae bacterium RIFOXYB12_FULL_65_16]